jgi:hypothetical protein
VAKTQDNDPTWMLIFKAHRISFVKVNKGFLAVQETNELSSFVISIQNGE